MKKVMIIMVLIFSLIGYVYADKLSQYPLTSTLSNNDTIIVIHNAANGQVNWDSMKELFSKNINWQDINGTISQYNVNWTDISQGALSTNIVCWKANNQPGKCTSSISGVNCTSCN